MNDEHYWVEGLHPLGFWQPLYSFRKSEAQMAHHTLRYILRLDRLPRELVEYEDFRVNSGDLDSWEFDPEPSVREQYARMSSQTPSQGSQRRSKATGHALQPIESQNGSEPRTGHAKKRICPECRDENPKKRCIRRADHEGRHKDSGGKRWLGA